MTTGMFRNVDPTVNACLWTADEMNDDYGRYGSTILNPEKAGMNIAYHLGNIYDRAAEFYFMLDPALELHASQYMYMGGLIGKMFYEIFYPKVYADVEVVYPEDPEQEYL